MPRVTDAQVRKLMEELTKHGRIGRAAMVAGMDRKTGRRYAGTGKMPSQMKVKRDWLTRASPFEPVWDHIVEMLRWAPELEAKTIFEYLNTLAELDETRPSFADGQVRTLQRHIRRWRAAEGPPKEVYFAQEHRPGEAMQTDFTDATQLSVTLGGEPFAHLLCHSCLPYSNWQSATVCYSESGLALRRGVQTAVFKLGRVPTWHQTDNSTAATHRLAEDAEGERGFNEAYVSFMEHLGMEPRTIAVGKKEQNGDIEAANNALKGRLNQYLMLRGSRDFESLLAYQNWIDRVVSKANSRRTTKVREELAVMRPLQVSRMQEYDEDDFLVSKWSTIRVKFNTYSVPSRLIAETVRVRLYEDRLEVYFAGVPQFEVERLRGRHGHRINYRHIIWSLVRKPGAFRRYHYREELFPSLIFRRAYDRLVEAKTERAADLEYLRLLHLAASTMQEHVELALGMLLEEDELPTLDAVLGLVDTRPKPVPHVPAPVVDLTVYDRLLSTVRP